MTPPSSPKNLKSQPLSIASVIIASTIIGLMARCVRLKGRGLWLDEAMALHFASRSYAQILRDCFTFDVHPPLYYCFLRLWSQFFGDSEIAIRMPSILAGVISIPLIYFAGKNLRNSQAGLISALLITVAPQFISASQEARPYSLLATLGFLSLSLFPMEANSVRRTNWKKLSGFVISTSFFVALHSLALLSILAFDLFLFLQIVQNHSFKAELKRILLINLPVIPSLPWVLNILWRRDQVLDNLSWIKSPFQISFAMDMFRDCIGGNLAFLFFLAMIGILFFKSFSLSKRSGLQSPFGFQLGLTLALFWFLAPVLSMIAADSLGIHLSILRYTLVANSGILLLLGILFSEVEHHLCLPVKALSVFTYFVIAITYYLESPPYADLQEKWNLLTQTISSSSDHHAPIIIFKEYCHFPLEYYATRLKTPLKNQRIYEREISHAAERIKNEIKSNEDFWLVLCRTDKSELAPFGLPPEIFPKMELYGAFVALFHFEAKAKLLSKYPAHASLKNQMKRSF